MGRLGVFGGVVGQLPWREMKQDMGPISVNSPTWGTDDSITQGAPPIATASHNNTAP